MMFALFRIALCSPALAAPRYYAGYYFGLQRLQRVALFDNSGGKYRRPLLTLLEQYAICNTHAAPKARMYTILILPVCAGDCAYAPVADKSSEETTYRTTLRVIRRLGVGGEWA